jgi:hypothetical protein
MLRNNRLFPWVEGNFEGVIEIIKKKKDYAGTKWNNKKEK